ncbi:MAG: DUF4405 domain-containing protein [Akkermansiaceae bacterium]|nr:DUF4405 domain-containing protein [Akkermansiaceae bacterium]
MKKILPRILNYILYTSGILIAGSGFLIKWKIPHGPEGRTTSLWGLDRHEWRDVHLWGGILIVVLVVWHLWLHRRWIMNVACQKHSIRLLAGLLAPILLIGVLAVTPLANPPDSHGDGERCSECGANGRGHRGDDMERKHRGRGDSAGRLSGGNKKG